MSKKLFTGIPEYVRITIYSQARYLLSFSNFNRDNDLDDIIQNLLLFYLDKFYKKDIPSEAYVVTSLRNEAKRLRKTKMYEHFGLFCSLEDLTECPEALKITNSFDGVEIDLLTSVVGEHLSDRENLVLKMILDGYSIDQIARTIHIAKASIYKILEKIKKFCKT